MLEDTVINVKHLSKAYKLYDKKSDRLKESLSITGKQYHKLFYALNDVNFFVRRGETVGIIGTNGSGKSTLLKILAGVITPTDGDVAVHGKVSALLELGAGFNPEYTGLENIMLNGTMMGYTKSEMSQKQDSIINFADIGEYINQPVKNYSSGMFARLAFAVAISVEPEILIVDETLSVGDVFFQNKCFRKFKQLQNNGTSVLFVSHDITAIKQMCSSVLWLEHGEQQMFGVCSHVCTEYFNSQTQRMNAANNTYLKEVNGNNNKIKAIDNAVQTFPKIYPSKDSMFSQKAEIVSVFIKDINDRLVENMEADAYYTVCIVSKFVEEMNNVIIGFVISNHKGIIVISENTYANSQKGITVLKDEIIETRFKFKLPQLRSGQYEISPAIALGIQENHVNLTWLHGVLKVDIERQGYELSEIGVPCQLENVRMQHVNLV